MSCEHLIVDKRGATDWVRLNRPAQLNTLNPPLPSELNDNFAGLQRDYAVRVVVLQGACRAFCAGLDMKAGGGTMLGAGIDALLHKRRPRHGGVV
jgi:enoyl-CoA hydratase